MAGMCRAYEDWTVKMEKIEKSNSPILQTATKKLAELHKGGFSQVYIGLHVSMLLLVRSHNLLDRSCCDLLSSNQPGMAVH